MNVNFQWSASGSCYVPYALISRQELGKKVFLEEIAYAAKWAFIFVPKSSYDGQYTLVLPLMRGLLVPISSPSKFCVKGTQFVLGDNIGRRVLTVVDGDLSESCTPCDLCAKVLECAVSGKCVAITGQRPLVSVLAECWEPQEQYIGKIIDYMALRELFEKRGIKRGYVGFYTLTVYFAGGSSSSSYAGPVIHTSASNNTCSPPALAANSGTACSCFRHTWSSTTAGV